MSKHTPSPWTIQRPINDKGIEKTYVWTTLGLVAEVCHHNKEANARLIAAAPELLETLERILHNYIDSRDQDDPDIMEAKIVIRKAKGEV